MDIINSFMKSKDEKVNKFISKAVLLNTVEKCMSSQLVVKQRRYLALKPRVTRFFHGEVSSAPNWIQSYFRSRSPSSIGRIKNDATSADLMCINFVADLPRNEYNNVWREIPAEPWPIVCTWYNGLELIGYSDTETARQWDQFSIYGEFSY